MKTTIIPSLLSLAALVATAGCGKPPAAGGPPGEFMVQAVVAPAVRDTVRNEVQVVGSLAARDTLDVVSEITAPVKEILFTEGEVVREGQEIARLDDEKLSARLAEAKARRQLAETNYGRAQELFQSQTISQQEFDQAKAEFDVAVAGYNLLARELEDTVIKAPFDGVVGARMVSPGQFMSVGQPVTRLVRLDPLEVNFRIPERYVGMIRNGQPVSMESVAMPGAAIEGTIFYVDPVIDTATRTVAAKARVANPDRTLKPGLFGNLKVVLEERQDALVIPESAVRYAGDQASVVVMNGEGKAEFRNVRVGQRAAGRVEITEGLAEGERVVVEGYQKMGPGTGIIISPASAKYGITPPAPETGAGEQPQG